MGPREDLRQHPRLVAPQVALLVVATQEAGAPIPCLVEDLSEGGARVLATARLEPGLAVALQLAGAAALPGSLVYRFERPGAGGYGCGYGVRFAAPLPAPGLLRAVGSAARLLVVHPERATCRQLVEALAAAGAPAVAVQSAADIPPLLGALAPGLQAVLVDARLAEDGGLDLLALLADRHPQLARAVLSDPMYPAMCIRRRAAPACAVWTPPWQAAHLRRLLAELL